MNQMHQSSDGFDDRWLVVAGFAMVVLLTVILYLTPPARAYEISIYDAFPWYFWMLALVSLFLGHVVVVRSALNENSHWRHGLLLVIAVLALLLFLPSFRGYAVFGRADILTHVGFIADIDKTGAVGRGNIYPNIHLLILTLSYATGVEPNTVIMSIIGIVSLFMIVSSVVLLVTIFDRQRALLSLPFMTLLVNSQSVPYVVSTLLLPFIFYLFFKERETHAVRIRVALALTLFALVIYHPLTTLFLLLVFLVYTVGRIINRSDLLGPSTDQLPAVGSTPMAQLMIATFGVWYLSFSKVFVRVQDVFWTLLAPGGGKSDLDTYSSVVAQYTPTLTDLIRIGLLRYGIAAILLSAGGLYSLLLVAAAIRDRTKLSVTQWMLIGSFTLFSGLSVLFLLLDLVGLGFGRPLLYAMLFGAILTGSVFHELLESPGWERVGRVTLYGTIAAFVVISTFGMFASPLVVHPNSQVTEGELSGGEWYLENRDTGITHMEYGIDMYRVKDALYGRETSPDDKVITGTNTGIPLHFNYTNTPRVGDNYPDDRYMTITRSGRIFYPQMYPDYRDFWGFTRSDFGRLERDPTVNHVYSSSEFDTYLVNGTQEG